MPAPLRPAFIYWPVVGAVVTFSKCRMMIDDDSGGGVRCTDDHYRDNDYRIWWWACEVLTCASWSADCSAYSVGICLFRLRIASGQGCASRVFKSCPWLVPIIIGLLPFFLYNCLLPSYMFMWLACFLSLTWGPVVHWMWMKCLSILPIKQFSPPQLPLLTPLDSKSIHRKRCCRLITWPKIG